MLYCGAVARGGPQIQEFVLSKYSETNVSAKQRSLLLNALGCTSESDLIKKYGRLLHVYCLPGCRSLKPGRYQYYINIASEL